MRNNLINLLLRSAVLAASISLCLGQAAHALTYWWDTNDTSTGFGTASGTWGTSAFWSTSISGIATTANPTITTADDVNFGTPAPGLGAGSVNGPATVQGFLSMTFGNNTGVISLVGGTLDLASTSTISVGGTVPTISTVLQGSGSNLIKTGAGGLTFQGASANTYSGLTTVNAGTLRLNKTAGVNAIAGNILVSGSGRLVNLVNNQIADTATVTLNAPGASWSLNAFSETVANVDMQNAVPNVSNGLATGTAGKLTVTGTLNHALGDITLNSSGAGGNSTITANTVTNTGGTWVFGTQNGTQSLVVGSGGLTIGGGSTIAVNATGGSANFISLGGNVTSQANAATNTISGAGTLRLNATRTFDVADGAAASDLTVSMIVANGSATGAINKTGAGTMILSAANTYTGLTTVSGGTLALGLGGASTTPAASRSAPTARLTFPRKPAATQ